MSLQGMIDKDLEACFSKEDFAVLAIHYFNEETENIDIIFDEKTDVILERGEYAGVEATVPSFSIATKKAFNINHKSLFVIGLDTFGVFETHKQNDGTTKVYLERQ